MPDARVKSTDVLDGGFDQARVVRCGVVATTPDPFVWRATNVQPSPSTGLPHQTQPRLDLRHVPGHAGRPLFYPLPPANPRDEYAREEQSAKEQHRLNGKQGGDRHPGKSEPDTEQACGREGTVALTDDAGPVRVAR
jgi:hypothetical protein